MVLVHSLNMDLLDTHLDIYIFQDDYLLCILHLERKVLGMDLYSFDCNILRLDHSRHFWYILDHNLQRMDYRIVLVRIHK